MVVKQYMGKSCKGNIGKQGDENDVIIQVGYYKNSFGCIKKINKAFTSLVGY